MEESRDVMFNDPVRVLSTGYQSEGYFHQWLKRTIDGREYATALVERVTDGSMVYVEIEQLIFKTHKYRDYCM